MSSVLLEYIEELRRAVPEPSFEPDLDDIDEKADKLMKEQMDLASGAVRKGILEQGEGTESPAEGDLVYFHLSLKKEDGEVLETTRLDEDGSGIPKAYVLGRGRRLPRGWELALEEMLRGERAAFKISPEYSFAQKGCSLKPPRGLPADASLVIDVQIVNWYRKSSVKAEGQNGVVKRTVRESESWEHPRLPFEVQVLLKARVPSSSGRQGEGAPYFATETPVRWTLGSGAVGALLEEGICGMAKGELAFISCPAEQAGSPSSLVPAPPDGVDRVEYEVELHSMIQVRDLTGTGEVTKRRVKEGVGEFPIDCPLEDNAVRIHYKGYLPDTGKVFYDSRGADGKAAALDFDTGVSAVPEAVDMCIRLMTPQEIAVVRSVPKFAYEGRTDRPPGCPTDAVVEFEVQLLSFEKTPHWQSMTAADKISRAEQLRQQGNTTFKLGRLHLARQKYLKAMKLLDNAYDAETEEQMQAASTAKASCQVNLAFICQKEDNFSECFSWCEKALREQPDHPKALYRRGTTHALLGNYVEAERDLQLARKADPASAAEIKRELAKMKQRQRMADKKQRQDLKSFFDRRK